MAATSPHTGFPRSRLPHQQNFLSVHDVSEMSWLTISRNIVQGPECYKTGISDPGKVVCLTKLFMCFGGKHHRGVLSLTFLTRGFLGSSSHLPFILAALLAARYSSSVTSSLKQLLKIKVERLSITRDLKGLLSNIWVSPGRIFSS